MNQIAAATEQRQAEKERATKAIQSALTKLSEQRRVLDRWEQVNLVEAVSSCYSGCYRLAVVACEIALTAPDRRSPLSDFPKEYDGWDLSQLNACLKVLIDAPVRQFPHFGPIV